MISLVSDYEQIYTLIPDKKFLTPEVLEILVKILNKGHFQLSESREYTLIRLTEFDKQVYSRDCFFVEYTLKGFNLIVYKHIEEKATTYSNDNIRSYFPLDQLDLALKEGYQYFFND